jgi:hypothetical protein
MIKILDADDWVVVMKDDEVIYEGHAPRTLDLYDILRDVQPDSVSLQAGSFETGQFVPDSVGG